VVVATGTTVGDAADAVTADETAQDVPRADPTAETDQEADPTAEGALMALQDVTTGDPVTSDLAANDPQPQPVRRQSDYALAGLIEMQC
jgi:hypothetical protein